MIGKLPLEFLLLGFVLGIFGFVAMYSGPDLPRITVYSGLAGAVLCLCWAVLTRRGVRYRMLALSSIAVVTGAVFTGVVLVCEKAFANDGPERDVLMLGIVAVACCASVLIRLARIEDGG